MEAFYRSPELLHAGHQDACHGGESRFRSGSTGPALGQSTRGLLAGARVHRLDGARGAVELAGPRRALGRLGEARLSARPPSGRDGDDSSNGGRVGRIHIVQELAPSHLDAAVQELDPIRSNMDKLRNILSMFTWKEIYWRKKL